MKKTHRTLASVLLCVGAVIVVGCVGDPIPDGSEFDNAETYNAETYISDLLSKLGNVANGTTVGLSNDFTPNCATRNAPDASYIWSAPVLGLYTFDTFGSEFDTILHLRPYNNSSQLLACNDDANGSLQSSVSLNLTAGQVVFVVVDGYSGSTGKYKLNIATTACVSGCCINGQNYQNGQLNPSNQCLICDTSKSTSSWSNNNGLWIRAGGSGYCKFGACIGGGCPYNSPATCSTHTADCDGVCSGGVVVTACYGGGAD
jgi:hypothetical protein